MKTSLKDIAETLKLSKTTISWVLSGKGDEKGIKPKVNFRIAHTQNSILLHFKVRSGSYE